MRVEVTERLLNINRGFYQSFAEPFRSKRTRLQPGMLRVLESLPLDADLLDLGCAHGLLAQFLDDKAFSGRYIGLDASRPLLNKVPQGLGPPRYIFEVADLSGADWPKIARSALLDDSAPKSSPERATLFDWIFAFSVLHHLPSADLRRGTVAAVRSLLAPRGHVAVSVWDFLASSRLEQRIVPWEMVGLDETDVDDRDYLVEWREGGTGYRYVHHFDGGELRDLAEGGGFEVREEYRSDGENHRLGQYQIWVLDPRS